MALFWSWSIRLRYPQVTCEYTEPLNVSQLDQSTVYQSAQKGLALGMLKLSNQANKPLMQSIVVWVCCPDILCGHYQLPKISPWLMCNQVRIPSVLQCGQIFKTLLILKHYQPKDSHILCSHRQRGFLQQDCPHASNIFKHLFTIKGAPIVQFTGQSRIVQVPKALLPFWGIRVSFTQFPVS